MDQVIELARRLGEHLSKHDRTLQLKAAQEAVDGDNEAGEMVKSYQQQMQRITELEKAQKPIEVTDKQKLRELEEKIAINPVLSNLTRRQVDFVEMMRKVKEAIDSELQISI
jgi:cell fate (sporulation/competence/biofilm development) regulator YlbF (YheA/YmcA/DUF963 family)